MFESSWSTDTPDVLSSWEFSVVCTPVCVVSDALAAVLSCDCDATRLAACDTRSGEPPCVANVVSSTPSMTVVLFAPPLAAPDVPSRSWLGVVATAALTWIDEESPTAPAGAVGLSSSIQVNAAVATTPSQLRDGTSGAASGGANSTTVIDGVLDTTFATQGGSPDLVSQAASLVASQSQDSTAASASLTTQTGVQTTLNSQLDSTSGVSVDQELSNMVGLQNAYGAGGKIISALESMFNSLLAAVNP